MDSPERQAVFFAALYMFSYRTVRRCVLKLGGTETDAEDVFQETLVVLLDKVRSGTFRLDASLNTFVYAISRNIWLNQLKQRSRLPAAELPKATDVPDPIWEVEDDATFNLLLQERIVGLVESLRPSCRMLLKSIYFLNMNIQQLRKRMGYANTHTASNVKYKCLQQLKAAAGRDPQLRAIAPLP